MDFHGGQPLLSYTLKDLKGLKGLNDLNCDYSNQFKSCIGLKVICRIHSQGFKLLIVKPSRLQIFSKTFKSCADLSKVFET